MFLDPKAMKLEDMAESAREIAEGGKDDDDSNELSSQSRAQQLKKVAIPEKKKLRIAKMKAFKEEILRLCK